MLISSMVYVPQKSSSEPYQQSLNVYPLDSTAIYHSWVSASYSGSTKNDPPSRMMASADAFCIGLSNCNLAGAVGWVGWLARATRRVGSYWMWLMACCCAGVSVSLAEGVNWRSVCCGVAKIETLTMVASIHVNKCFIKQIIIDYLISPPMRLYTLPFRRMIT